MAQAVLFFAVKSIAGGILARAGGELFSKIAGHGDDSGKQLLELNQKILDEVQNLGVSLEEVKTAIAALSSQIAEAVVALRKDDLRQSASAIGSQYALVQDIINASKSVSADTSITKEERQAKFNALNNRLMECLRTAALTIPAYLDLINDALADPTMNSLVQQIAEVVLKRSVDVVHYYDQTMAEVSKHTGLWSSAHSSRLSQVGFYWFAVLKGLSLLWMVSGEPSVALPEGIETFTRQKSQLETQQTLIRALLGETVCSIAEQLLTSGQPGSKPVSVYISQALSDTGMGVQPPNAGGNLFGAWELKLGDEVQQAVQVGKALSKYRLDIVSMAPAGYGGQPYVLRPMFDFSQAIVWAVRPVDVQCSAWVFASMPAAHGDKPRFLNVVPLNASLAPDPHNPSGTIEGDWTKLESLSNDCRMMIELAKWYICLAAARGMLLTYVRSAEKAAVSPGLVPAGQQEEGEGVSRSTACMATAPLMRIRG